jgi:hypothetical protein
MPAHLSDAWIGALDEAVRSHDGLAAATAGVHLVIEQVVVDGPVDATTMSLPDEGVHPPGRSAAGAGDGADVVVWHVAIHDGTVRVVPGPAVPADGGADADATPLVRFTTDRDTARAVVEGTTTAQGAFMAGHLRVGGDTTALVTHNALLAGLGDIFANVTVD